MNKKTLSQSGDLFMQLLQHEVKQLDKEQVKESLSPEKLAMPDKNLLEEIYRKMGIVLWQ